MTSVLELPWKVAPSAAFSGAQLISDPLDPCISEDRDSQRASPLKSFFDPCGSSPMMERGIWASVGTKGRQQVEKRELVGGRPAFSRVFDMAPCSAVPRSRTC